MDVIVVTGFPRSGTSATAGLIERMGAQTLPKTVDGKYNPDYQENAILNGMCEGVAHWHKLVMPRRNPHLLNAIAFYLLEHWEDKDKPLMVKSPTIGAMPEEFNFVIGTMEDRLGISLGVLWIVCDRSREAIAASANNFTNEHFGIDYMRDRVSTYYEGLSRFIDGMDASSQDEILAVEYEVLLNNWQWYAGQLTAMLPELRVPEDGGIRSELNHFGAPDGKEAQR